MTEAAMRIAYLYREPTQSRQPISGYAVRGNSMIHVFEVPYHELVVSMLGRCLGHAQGSTLAKNSRLDGLKRFAERSVAALRWQGARDLCARAFKRLTNSTRAALRPARRA